MAFLDNSNYHLITQDINSCGNNNSHANSLHHITDPYCSYILIDINKRPDFLILNKDNKVNNLYSSEPNRKGNVSPFISDSYNDNFISKESNFSFNQVEIGIRKYVDNNEAKFLSRLCKGPPESFRWMSWIIAAQIDKIRNPDFYYDLLSQQIEQTVEKQIKKDITRTIMHESLIRSSELKVSLYNVLKAYSLFDKEVSYCQGMNFIISFLLIMSDFNEIDTFYMMIYLFISNKNSITNFGIRGFYINNFPLLHLYEYIFNGIFLNCLPNLKNHFDKLEIPNELWISKWLQTLFTICLPNDILIRLWDCFLVRGLDFIFNFSITILKYFEEDLLKLNDISYVSDFLKNINPYFKNEKTSKIDVEKLICDALNINFREKNINFFRNEYEKFYNINLKIDSKKDFIEMYKNFKTNNNKIDLMESNEKLSENLFKDDVENNFDYEENTNIITNKVMTHILNIKMIKEDAKVVVDNLKNCNKIVNFPENLKNEDQRNNNPSKFSKSSEKIYNVLKFDNDCKK